MARRRCPVCGSKQWHKEPSSGLISCSEGHILQNYRNEINEVGGEGHAHTLKKRALKSGNKKSAAESKHDSKRVYYGDRARYLYFQCQQLILRQQVSSLIKLWELPPEFEILCRDIWALHLSLLPEPPPEFDSHEPGDDSAEGDGGHKVKEAKQTPIDEHSDVGGNKEADATAGSSSEGDEDPELAELMRENSELSSSSSDEGEGDPATRAALSTVRKASSARVTMRYQKPSSAIAVLMLACWMMRVPVLYRDFIRIIESYELPYLDQVRHLPLSMMPHLNQHMVKSLSPTRAPDIFAVHRLTIRLAELCYSKYGVHTPELNAGPMLWRVVRCLGGTAILYDLTKRLSHVLCLRVTLLPRLTGAGGRRHDKAPPEVAFVAATVIVLKMVYGLDGSPRRPTGPDDPASAFPRLEEFVSMLKALDLEDENSRDNVFSSGTPMLVGDLHEDMLDEYLDFCERALLPPESNRQNDRDLPAKYFTLTRKDAGCRVLGESAHIELRSQSSDGHAGGMLNCAKSYSLYDSRDVAGSLPEELELIVGRYARWIGVEVDYLCVVIESFERRIGRWCEERRRRQRDG